MPDVEGDDGTGGHLIPTARELDEFRQEARAWLTANFSWARRGTEQEHAAWDRTRLMSLAREVQRRLYDAGYAGIAVPVECGGQGLSVEHEQVFDEEAAEYDLPSHLLGVSINILGSALLRFGSPDQIHRYVPEILGGNKVFVQLLSEPAAGSDLAGLVTRADLRDEDGSFLINGQKCWSSGADIADYALCPARTDWSVPKHQGITVFIMDLHAQGVEVRPITQIDGGDGFCEEFLTDVVVPVADVVGGVNEGWRVVRGLLEIEHAWAGRHNTGRRAPGSVDPLVALARRLGLYESDVGVRRDLARVHVAIKAHEALTARIRQCIDAGTIPGSYGGLVKMSSDNLVQSRSEAGLALAGRRALGWTENWGADKEWSQDFLSSRSASIAGGSREIQRNNIAESVLGLPREVDQFRSTPFRDIPRN